MEKNILILTNHFYPETFKINDICLKLSEKKYKVKVITSIPNYPRGDFFNGYSYFKRNRERLNNNLEVIRLPIVSRGKAGSIRLILNYLTYFISLIVYFFFNLFSLRKYDVIFIHHTSPPFLIIPPAILKPFYNFKLILWDLDMWPETLKAMKIIENRLGLYTLEMIMSGLYKACDNILLSSKSFYEIAKNRVDDNKLMYFPNWADQILETSNSKKRKKNNNTINVMYTGNIGYAQDFEGLVKVLRNCYFVNFIFVGEGRYLHKLKKLIKKFRLQNRVKFKTFQKLENLPEIVESADFMYLSLKNKEIFKKTVPAKLQTYMCLKKPIIAMISGEANEIIQESNCGMVVNSGDYAGLENIFQKSRMLKQADLDKMSIESHNFYKKNFSFKYRINEIEDLFNF